MRFSGTQEDYRHNEQPIRRFELASNIASVSTDAYISFINSDGEWETTDKVFSVANPASIYSGDGPDETYYGESGYAVYMADSGYWEIIQLQCFRTLKAVE